MQHPEAKYAIAVLVLAFFILGFLFRKIITYINCPLPNYKGIIGKGKTNNLILFHLSISFGLTLVLFTLLRERWLTTPLFEDTAIRLLSISGLWVIFFYITGCCIERYLVVTDKEYKNWKYPV
jgi:hypothetical protein